MRWWLTSLNNPVILLSPKKWLMIITRSLLFPQEWAEPKLSDMPPAGDCCQWIVGTVWYPHRGRHSWLHPQLGWRGGPPTQALTHCTLSQLDGKGIRPVPSRLYMLQHKMSLSLRRRFFLYSYKAHTAAETSRVSCSLGS